MKTFWMFSNILFIKLQNPESFLFLAVCQWWWHPHVGDWPSPDSTSVLLLLWSTGFSPVLSFPLPPSFALICGGSVASISSFHFLQQIKFALPTCLLFVFLPSSPALSLFRFLSLQDSSSSVGSGEFTGIKELDDISQEIAQLQR